MQGYSPVFSMLKRVEQLLHPLHLPLMMQPESIPGKPDSGAGCSGVQHLLLCAIWRRHRQPGLGLGLGLCCQRLVELLL